MVTDEERESQRDEDTEEETSQTEDQSTSEGADKSKDTSKDDDDSSDVDDDDDDDDELFDRERARKTIKTLRAKEKEGIAAKKELERLQKEQRKAERKGQSEVERLSNDLEETQTENSSLKQELNELRTRIQRSSFIEQIGYDTRIARQAWNSLNDVDVEPEFDEKHRLSNRKAVVKALKEYDAELFSTGSADGEKRETDTEGHTDMNTLIRQGFGRA